MQSNRHEEEQTHGFLVDLAIAVALWAVVMSALVNILYA